MYPVTTAEVARVHELKVGTHWAKSLSWGAVDEHFFLFSFLFTGAQLVFEKRAEAIKPEERWYRQYRDRGDELSQEESLHETRTHSHKAEVDTHTWLT